MKKTIFLLAVVSLGSCGILSANNPDKTKKVSEPGKDNGVKTAAATVKPDTIAKPKQVAPSNTSGTYEMKAPSVFTFTVLNTFFNLPIQKK